MQISIFQSATHNQTPEQRIERLQAIASSTNADLIVCPELFMSGYNAGEDLKRFAEPADGPSANAVKRVARETNTAFVYGYPESFGGEIYNSALCISATGEPVANHRKLLLPPGFEADYFTPAPGLTIFELSGIRMAILICYDSEFPESVRAVGEAGAQVVIVPTALFEQWGVVAERVIPARAFENGVYMIYANHAGTEGDITYLGRSCIVGPTGLDLARAGNDEEIISATVDMAAVDAAQNRLPYHRDVRVLRERLAGQ